MAFRERRFEAGLPAGHVLKVPFLREPFLKEAFLKEAM
jgi:hypothetical protein